MESNNPSTSDSQKANNAILRVAYLIAAADGEVKNAELEVFKKTLGALQGAKMGDEDTTMLIENIVEDARKLTILRDFYDEDQLTKAFLAKVQKDVQTIQESKLSARKAFAVWTSICMADKEYSSFERKLVKTLQSACNGFGGVLEVSADLSKKMMVGGAAAGLGMFLGGPLVGLAAIAGIVAARKAAADGNKKVLTFGTDSFVSDEYLAEVEERCAEIDAAQDQLAACASEEQKSNVEDSINCLVGSFKEFINNIEA